MTDDKQDVYKSFKQLVNMPRTNLERWLKSDEAAKVGWNNQGKKTDASGQESFGHKSGVKIITILSKKKDQLTDGDYQHMRKVIAYIKRHLAQKPTKENVESSRWRYSLMNWGHDPLKD